MQYKKIQIFLSLILLISIFCPMVVGAQSQAQEPGIVINEVQASGLETDTGTQEFIELKNISEADVDISGWTLEYINSSSNTSAIYTFPLNTIFPAESYMLGVCSRAPTDYLASFITKFIYNMTSNCLATNNVGINLKQNNEVIDYLGWTSLASSTSDDIVPGMTGGNSIERKIVNERTINSVSNKSDFIVGMPTPGFMPQLPLPEDEPEPPPEPSPEPTPEPVVDPTPTPEPTPEPTPQTIEYMSIDLSELYIDPVSPETDTDNEWVEIYNPNEQTVNLSGYTIYTGANFTYKYAFPTDYKIESKSYLSISSSESSLALANSGGAAKIASPDGTIVAQTSYETAKPGYSWAKSSDGVWAWTSAPTKDNPNIIVIAPMPISKAVSKAQKAKATTAKKVAATKVKTTAKKATKVKGAIDSPDLVSAPTPLPFWLLAPLGILAVLYACYEYRFEIGNYIYQFKQNRANSKLNR